MADDHIPERSRISISPDQILLQVAHALRGKVNDIDDVIDANTTTGEAVEHVRRLLQYHQDLPIQLTSTTAGDNTAPNPTPDHVEHVHKLLQNQHRIPTQTPSSTASDPIPTLADRNASASALHASLHDNKRHILIGATGSVAIVKLRSIIQGLTNTPSQPGQPDLSIRIILTPSATRFLTGSTAEQPSIAILITLPCVDAVYIDEDEWAEPWHRGASILHIELRRWADVMLIAPLSANTLAKIAGGMAEGLLCSVVRAWDANAGAEGGGVAHTRANDINENVAHLNRNSAILHPSINDNISLDISQPSINATTTTHNHDRGHGKIKKILLAPAMNTLMYTNPITARHLASLPPWCTVLSPQESKELACGDVGSGAMMDYKEIVDHVLKVL